MSSVTDDLCVDWMVLMQDDILAHAVHIVCSVDEEWGSGLTGEAGDGQKGSVLLDNPGGQHEVQLDDGSPIVSAISFVILSTILDAYAIQKAFFFLFPFYPLFVLSFFLFFLFCMQG